MYNARIDQQTDRKKNNLKQEIKHLRAENRELKLALNSISDGVIVTDIKEKIVRMNKVAEKLTGRSFKEAKGKKVHSIYKTVDPKSQKYKNNPIDRLLNKNKDNTFTDNTILLSKNNIEYYIFEFCSPVRNHNQETTGFLLIFRNITDKENVQEDLRIKDRAIEACLNAVATCDLEGHLTYANPSFVSMWGYNNKKELYGKSIEDFWHKKKDAEKVINIIKNRGNWEGELKAKTKNGNLMDIRLKAKIVNDNNILF